MRGLLVVVVAVVLASCGDDDEKKQCNRSDWTGTYDVTFVEVTGDCGPINSEVVSLDHGFGSSSCTVYKNEWSSNDCTFERTVGCIDAGHGTSTGLSMKVTQRDDDGAYLSGAYGAAVGDIDTGDTLCNSGYNVVMERR